MPLHLFIRRGPRPGYPAGSVPLPGHDVHVIAMMNTLKKNAITPCDNTMPRPPATRSG
jgi:hypothetical protein